MWDYAMRLFLIRHAHAGDRTAGSRDKFRPLTPKGHRRAEELATMLEGQGVARVLSSPATRCWQTVAPVAKALGLEVEEVDELWEGALLDDVFALFEGLGEPVVAACSHGDIIPEVVDALNRKGVPVSGRGCEKGSIWVLDHDGRQWTAAAYVAKSQSQLPAL
ncbi:MAG: histidine phosphatase family protein [Acidimicrobiales bacterium]